MRKMIRAAAALATATAAVIALSGTVEAKPADAWAGCPDGAVCIYPQNQNPAVKPTHVFYSYGAHNLSNQVGNHWVLNNQYGGATANLCAQYNGGGCGGSIAAKTGVYANLTPVNSIRLNP
uniref:Peptidase inhibitor family I36 n=1 Tax=Streptomyces sp. NBC_00049 TaxID=2903617 RepID=A0AAU2JJJ7_9ACTN